MKRKQWLLRMGMAFAMLSEPQPAPAPWKICEMRQNMANRIDKRH